MSEHAMARTTHTTEIRQVNEMNAVLASGRRRLTAGAVDLHAGVADDALLRRLKPAGPPSYPYVYGVFTRPRGTEGNVLVELHTAQLRAISDQLALPRHIWGV